MVAGALMATLVTGFSQPVITQQPQSCTNAVGTTATFTVTATGTEPLAYQWQKSTGTWTDLAGCTDINLCLTNVQTADAGDYRVVVTNVDGAVTSDAATLTVGVPPGVLSVVNLHPSVSLGALAGLRVSASGTLPLNFQWYRDDVALPGKTANVISFPSVQLTDLGLYTVVVTNVYGAVTSAPVTLNVDPTFTKITTGAIVTDLAGPRHGPAWGDYNNDGYPDLYVHETGPSRTEVIYRNNRDGTFTRIVEPTLQGGFGDYAAIFVAWADYDNDGLLDLLIPNDPYSNLLFRNRGDGTFQRMVAPPLTSSGTGSWAPIWGDYDRDGYLDVLVINTDLAPPNYVNWLYRNQGNGNFTKITSGPIVTEAGWWMGGGWVDYDEDGWLDLCLARYDAGKPGLYLCRNLGNGTFAHITNNVLATQTQRAASIAWADYNNEGHLGAFVVTAGDGPNILYHNEGSGTFRKMTAAEVGSLVSDKTLWGAGVWGDYDNDGFQDLFVSGGEYDPISQNFFSTTNLLYHNNGDGTFTKILTGSPVTESGQFGQPTWVDYDRDGFLDLFVVDQGNSASSADRLFRNNGNSNNWLCVQCVGTSSPRWGTGAKVRAKATIRGKEMWQLRLIDAGGFGFVAHFGLGDATNVDVLRIEWTSGIVQELHNVPVKQYLTVTEPARLSMPQPGVLQIQCWKGMCYSVETSPDLLTWRPLATVTNLNLKGGTQWTDPDAPGQSTRFYRAVKQ